MDEVRSIALLRAWGRHFAIGNSSPAKRLPEACKSAQVTRGHADRRRPFLAHHRDFGLWPFPASAGGQSTAALPAYFQTSIFLGNVHCIADLNVLVTDGALD